MKRQRRLRTTPSDRQLKLFEPVPPSGRPTTPAWTALPEETRRALTGLMTRLFVEHAGSGSDVPQGGAHEL